MPKKVLIFVDEIYEELELHYPRLRLLEAGHQVVIAGESKDTVYKGKYGYPCKPNITFDEVDVEGFNGLVIPGGYAPDKLRKIPKVLEITKLFHDKNKLIAFICHGGWIPVSADVIEGVKCTSYVAIKDDMINAGASWVDESVVVDQNFVSSRFPDDLPNFCKAILKSLNNAAS